MADSPVDHTVQYAAGAENSAWVSANAGSGKTHVLITRLVSLMLAGAAPERLLCLTYTRSAAAEMQERLHNLLGDWAVMPDDALKAAMRQRIGETPTRRQLERVRVLFARALETPGGLKVQTIHAFCESLLNRFPLEAGVPQGFRVLDERRARELVRQARRKLLATPPDEVFKAHFALLTRRLNEQQFARLADDIIAHRSLFAVASTLGDPAERAKIREEKLLALYDMPKLEAPDAPRQAFVAGLDRAQMVAVAGALKGKGTTDDKNALIFEYSAELMKQSAGRLKIWDELGRFFLTQQREPRKRLVTQKVTKEHPDIGAFLDEMQKAYIGAEEQANRYLTINVTLAIYAFADALLASIEQRKTELGYLDYDDLIDRTRALLTQSRSAQWVLYKLDGGVDHILVDEAQDTSPQQWQVIAALAEEFFSGEGVSHLTRTVFAVGDEKQSIFSFQGADPRKFDEMRRHFSTLAEHAGLPFGHLPLQDSWRSAPEILQAVDLIALNPEMTASLTEQGDEVRHMPRRTEAAGLVELWPLEKPDTQDAESFWDYPEISGTQETPRQRVAMRIADQIATWRDNPDCAIRPRDVLILVQNRDAFVSDMLRCLKARNIPVAGADRMILTNQIAVMDLMIAGQAALLPEDDLTFATYLRSPLGGLGEDDLFALCHDRGSASLWSRLRQAARAENAAPVLPAAVRHFENMLKIIDYVPPYEFYAELLGPLGGRKALVSRLGVEVDDPVDEFLNLALDYERLSPPNMQGFLAWIGSEEAEVKRDMEQGLDAVRIMTVHGAKGLEAPVVFMPDTCRRPVKSGGLEKGFTRTANGLLLWQPKKEMRSLLGQQANEENREAQSREHKRLLYVALTRARERLYIGGFLPARVTNPPAGSWYELIANGLEPDAAVITENDRTLLRLGTPDRAGPAAEKGDTDRTVDHAAVASAELPPWFQARAVAEKPLLDFQSPSSAVSGGGASGGFPADREAVLRGTLIHRLLEGLSGIPEDRRAEHCAAFLKFYRDEVTPDLGEQITEEVLGLMTTPELASLFGPDGRAEVSVAGRITLPDGSVRKLLGRIDRFVETGNAIIIADYKTTRTPPAEDTPLSGPLAAQMACYHALLSAARPEKKITCRVIWTATATARDLTAAELQAGLAEIAG